MTANKPEFLLFVDNLLTREECSRFKKYIDSSIEKAQYQKIDSLCANYDRVMLVDREFADMLWNRIKHLLPKTYNNQPLMCLNDHIRFSRYSPGEEFSIHKDGFNQDSNGYRSIFTVNVFLNDDFEGGATEFYYEDRSYRDAAVPKAGRGAIFYSQQFHCGCKVLSGNKYLFRTDVMTGML
jgi:hypothetical protein